MNQRKKQLKPLKVKEVKDIRWQHNNGVHRFKTCHQYGISQGAYYKIVRCERYKEVV